jgi:hypothetical protein
MGLYGKELSPGVFPKLGLIDYLLSDGYGITARQSAVMWAGFA